MTDQVRDALGKLLAQRMNPEYPGDVPILAEDLAPLMEKALRAVSAAAADQHNRTLTNPYYFDGIHVTDFVAAGIAVLTEGET